MPIVEDHALRLMRAVQEALEAGLPLDGGWRATRLETPIYPVGYINVTSSTPMRGQAYYAEQHRGVVSVWTRASRAEAANPAQCFNLCNDAHTILGQAILSASGFQVSQFACGAMTPQNPDGLTWGRSFFFTATTHEVG